MPIYDRLSCYDRLRTSTRTLRGLTRTLCAACFAGRGNQLWIDEMLRASIIDLRIAEPRLEPERSAHRHGLPLEIGAAAGVRATRVRGQLDGPLTWQPPLGLVISLSEALARGPRCLDPTVARRRGKHMQEYHRNVNSGRKLKGSRSRWSRRRKWGRIPNRASSLGAVAAGTSAQCERTRAEPEHERTRDPQDFRLQARVGADEPAG